MKNQKEIRFAVPKSVHKITSTLANMEGKTKTEFVKETLYKEITRRGGTIKPTKVTPSNAPITTHVTKQEKAAFITKCEVLGMTISNGMRFQLRNFVNQTPELLENEILAIKQATRQLTAVGVNLNQLVKAANKGKLNNKKTWALLVDLVKRITVLKATHQNLIDAAENRSVDCG